MLNVGLSVHHLSLAIASKEDYRGSNPQVLCQNGTRITSTATSAQALLHHNNLLHENVPAKRG